MNENRINLTKSINMTKGQRAMEAARVTFQGTLVDDAAAHWRVNKSSVIHARMVLQHGTQEQISAVVEGRSGVFGLAKEIRDKIKTKRTPYQHLDNPHRTENARLALELQKRMKEVVTHLTSLPMAEEVVAIVKARDRGYIDSRLAQSLQWLRDFHDVWTKRDQAAKQEAPPQSPGTDNHNSGDGHQAIGEQQNQSPAVGPAHEADREANNRGEVEIQRGHDKDFDY